jgi:hypothetical protein
LWFVVVSPTKSTSTTTPAAAIVEELTTLLLTLSLGLSNSLETTSLATLGLPSLSSSTERHDAATAKASSFGSRTGVVHDGKGSFIFGGLDSEDRGCAGAVDLLI